MAMNGILAVVGLAGTGKSTVVAMVQKATGAPVVYFGGVIVGEVRRRGLAVNEQTERTVREEVRRLHGMSAVAQLAADDIGKQLTEQPLVIIDGLYSYAEYEYLTERFPDTLRTLAVHAPRGLREERLGKRPHRPLTPDEITSRDLREISTLDKATPIVLADWHVVNDDSVDVLAERLDRVGLTDEPMSR